MNVKKDAKYVMINFILYQSRTKFCKVWIDPEVNLSIFLKKPSTSSVFNRNETKVTGF